MCNFFFLVGGATLRESKKVRYQGQPADRFVERSIRKFLVH